MRFRLAPERLDLVLAAVLFVGAEVQVAFDPATGWALVSQAVVAGVVTASVAVRRRYPAARRNRRSGPAGARRADQPPSRGRVIGGLVLRALRAGRLDDVALVHRGRAVLRRVEPAPVHRGPGRPANAIADFTAGAVLVMVFLRILVGRRDRQLASPSGNATSPGGRRSSTSGPGSRASCTTRSRTRLDDGGAGGRRAPCPRPRAGSTQGGALDDRARGPRARSPRCAGWSGCSAATTTTSSRRSRASPPSRRWSTGCGTPASPWSSQVDGQRRDLPVGIELSALPGGPGGLTNALKHAGRAHVRVHVRYGPDSLELEIADDGLGGPSAFPRAGTGWSASRSASPSTAANSRPARGPTAASSSASCCRRDDATRVLIADDQPLVRVGLRKILDFEPDIEVVGEAMDGEDAVRQTGRLSPDVVLMDIRMPVLDGIEATRRITTAHPDDPGADPDHVRARRVRLRGAPGRGQRVHAQGRAARGDRGRRPHRGARRGDARPGRHPRR